MIYDKGEGVIEFPIFSDKEGGGASQFLFFWLTRGGGGVRSPPPIFGWHNIWTAPYGFLAISHKQNTVKRKIRQILFLIDKGKGEGIFQK